MKELREKILKEIEEREELYNYYLEKIENFEVNGSYYEQRLLELRREIMTFEHVIELMIFDKVDDK